MNKIFICGGRTGGPLIPMIALCNQLDIIDKKIIIIGVKNSFESNYCKLKSLDISYLPEAKMNFLSFKFRFTLGYLIEVLKSMYSLFLLLFSFLKSIVLIITLKPKLILNAGSFLGVPLIYANKFLRLIGISKAKVIIHQQDPIMGLANKLTINLADVKSCVFEYSKEKYSSLTDAFLISNPIDYTKFQNLNSYIDKEFSKVFNDKKLKILFTGGGSGSKNINDWIYNNIDLLHKYNIINLTGRIQDKTDQERWKSNNKSNFYATDSTIDDMPKLLFDADIVVSRAGLSSMTEQSFLNKYTVLIPLKNSHQEKNAQLAGSNFLVCDEGSMDDLHSIFQSYDLGSNSLDLKGSIDNYNKVNSNYLNKILSII